MLLGLIIFNVLYQDIWIMNPKVKNKILPNIILMLNLIALVLIFMIDSVWKVLVSSGNIASLMIMFAVVHISVILVQSMILKKEELNGKEEFIFLVNQTVNLKDSKYALFLKKYIKTSSIFVIIYLVFSYQYMLFVYVLGHFIYGVVNYRSAWLAGVMEDIISVREKNYHYIILAATSIFVLLLNSYLPPIIVMIVISLPELLLQMYLQRYTYSQLVVKRKNYG